MKKISKFPSTDAQLRLKIVFNTLEIKQLQSQIDQLLFENRDEVDSFFFKNTIGSIANKN